MSFSGLIAAGYYYKEHAASGQFLAAGLNLLIALALHSKMTYRTEEAYQDILYPV